jgi:nicotinamide mononucleotide transporter
MLHLDGVAAALAWADPWLAPWFTAWGVPVSELEAWAFVLSLAMVGFNLRVNPWGWPLAIVSSLMYGVLFARSRLYGEASLQIVFVVLAAWGWWQWLRGVDAQAQSLAVRRLSGAGRRWAVLTVLALWPLTGLLLHRITDSDVPYLDALPTAGSLVGQWLLGRKWVENWPCWLAVNLISMGLFAYKQLWLTVILYGIFAMLSVWGWRQWLAMVDSPASRAARGSEA